MSARAPSVRDALNGVRLYLITDASPRVRPLEAFIEAAVAGGVGMVQLREKNLADGHLMEAAGRCAAACAKLGVPFIVNDRVDVALGCGASGVHIGQEDLPVQTVRRVAGREFIVGLSTHSREQIDRAADLDVDYLGVGPVYETPTKPGRPAVGLDLVRYAAERAKQPFFAIGGIDTRNAGAVIAAGAGGISVLRWISQSSDPRAAALRLMDEYDRTKRAPVG